MIDEVDELKAIAKNNGFILKSSQPEDLKEISGRSWFFRHELSGARLLFLENDDDNKAFSIAFKTPPSNSTGVFHILEHSVLCGSKKYPVKEPFVNLLKSSMQTFLNAMTFPDKTVYPVASTNEQDLFNLMNVYMDAVFNPLIYSKEEIFLQEGWHKELDEDGCEKISGVVFNEMKGALSDPDAVLFDALCQRLYPTTCYSFESGGEPKEIPNLSYDEFLDTHARHYSPENSYIHLYGNITVDYFAKFLEAFDKDYLTPAFNNRREITSNKKSFPNKLQTTSVSKREVFDVRMDIKPDNAVYASAFKIGSFDDLASFQMISTLMEVLLSSNVSPLKKRLLETGVAKEFYYSAISPVAEPAIFLACQGVEDEDALEVMQRVVREQMQEIVNGNFDKSLIEAQIDRFEFEMREQNFGVADGVIYALSSLSSWLYDDNEPIGALRYENTFKELRSMLNNGELEKLVSRVFLNNTQIASVRVLPIVEDEEEGKKHHPKDSEALTIKEQSQHLKEIQALPDKEEDINRLPFMRVLDVDNKTRKFEIDVQDLNSGALKRIKNLNVETHGINYFNTYLNLSNIEFDDLPFLSLMINLFGKFDTLKFSAEEIEVEKKRRCGRLSMSPVVIVTPNIHNPKLMLKVSASCLKDKTSLSSELAESILNETKFDDKQRLSQILMQQKIMSDQSIINAGHVFAMRRASSKVSESSLICEMMEGVAYKQFLDKICENLDESVDLILDKLRQLYKSLQDPRSVVFSYCSDDEESNLWMRETIEKLTCAQDSTMDAQNDAVIALDEKLRHGDEDHVKEAFAVKSDVTYTAIKNDFNLLQNRVDGNLFDGRFSYDGACPLVSRVLSYDYLWNTIRVQGGAYGCGFSGKLTGECGFYTYRDPNIKSSIETFRGASRWLSDFSPSEREMQGFIVSTVAGLDQPLKPSSIIARNESQFFSGLTEDDRVNLRKDVLEMSLDRVKNLADSVDEIAKKSPICVIGDREAIEKSEMFDNVVEL